MVGWSLITTGNSWKVVVSDMRRDSDLLLVPLACGSLYFSDCVGSLSVTLIPAGWPEYFFCRGHPKITDLNVGSIILYPH